MAVSGRLAGALRPKAFIQRTGNAPMPAKLKIDFVSDVSCPWCVVGLKSLEVALSRLTQTYTAEIHFQPFELNPQMGPGGQDIGEHISQKYGASSLDIGRSQELLKARGDAVGFHFDFERRGRIYNTFDAHRLLHWAGIEGKQHELKQALFSAYFTEGRDPSNHDVLASVAAGVGLDEARARQILESDEFAQDVRERERFFAGMGIDAVPSVIINDRHLVQGGQTAAVFERALRQLGSSGAPD
jgi:predicted DsbA family dithiol-disulfide isomerase